MRGKLDRGTRASFARTCLGKAGPRLAQSPSAIPPTRVPRTCRGRVTSASASSPQEHGGYGFCFGSAAGSRQKPARVDQGCQGMRTSDPRFPDAPSPLAASPWLVFGTPELDRDRRLFQLRGCVREPSAGEAAPVGLRSVAHRRVGHDLAKLLSAAAGDGDLGSPLQRVLA